MARASAHINPKSLLRDLNPERVGPSTFVFAVSLGGKFPTPEEFYALVKHLYKHKHSVIVSVADTLNIHNLTGLLEIPIDEAQQIIERSTHSFLKTYLGLDFDADRGLPPEGTTTLKYGVDEPEIEVKWQRWDAAMLAIPNYLELVRELERIVKDPSGEDEEALSQAVSNAVDEILIRRYKPKNLEEIKANLGDGKYKLVRDIHARYLMEEIPFLTIMQGGYCKKPDLSGIEKLPSDSYMKEMHRLGYSAHLAVKMLQLYAKKLGFRIDKNPKGRVKDRINTSFIYKAKDSCDLEYLKIEESILPYLDQLKDLERLNPQEVSPIYQRLTSGAGAAASAVASPLTEVSADDADTLHTGGGGGGGAAATASFFAPAARAAAVSAAGVADGADDIEDYVHPTDLSPSGAGLPGTPGLSARGGVPVVPGRASLSRSPSPPDAADGGGAGGSISSGDTVEEALKPTTGGAAAEQTSREDHQHTEDPDDGSVDSSGSDEEIAIEIAKVATAMARRHKGPTKRMLLCTARDSLLAVQEDRRDMARHVADQRTRMRVSAATADAEAAATHDRSAPPTSPAIAATAGGPA